MMYRDAVRKPTTPNQINIRPTPIIITGGEFKQIKIQSDFTKIKSQFPPPLFAPPPLRDPPHHLNRDWGSAARPRTDTHTIPFPFPFACAPPPVGRGGARDDDGSPGSDVYGSAARLPRDHDGVCEGAAKAAPWALRGGKRYLADTVAAQHAVRRVNGNPAAWSPRGGRPPHPRGPPPPPPGIAPPPGEEWRDVRPRQIKMKPPPPPGNYSCGPYDGYRGVWGWEYPNYNPPPLCPGDSIDASPHAALSGASRMSIGRFDVGTTFHHHC
eukprot:gene8460-17123_t